MALIIVISTGVLRIRWNVLSFSFSERENVKWSLGPSDFSFSDRIIILSVTDSIQHFGEIHSQHLINTISFYSKMTFFVGFERDLPCLIQSAVIRACSSFSKISAQ